MAVVRLIRNVTRSFRFVFCRFPSSAQLVALAWAGVHPVGLVRQACRCLCGRSGHLQQVAERSLEADVPAGRAGQDRSRLEALD